MTLFEGNLPQERQSHREGESAREREREREKKRKRERTHKRKQERNKERKKEDKREEKRERESERVRCQMIWEVQETGHHRLNLSHRVCPFGECAEQYLLALRQVEWTVVYGPRLSLVGEDLFFVHISDQNSCNTNVVFKNSDRDAYDWI